MKHAHLTNKQAIALFCLGLFQCIVGISWLVLGVRDKSWLSFVVGLIFLVIVGGSSFYRLLVGKHFSIGDAKVDQDKAESQKDVWTNFFIFFCIFITLGFLLAFVFAYLRK